MEITYTEPSLGGHKGPSASWTIRSAWQYDRTPMKPYRVLRGKKPIGSFLVRYQGRRVNLQTQDANEARRRAVLLSKGQWPPAGDAAAAVTAALEGKEPAAEHVPAPDGAPGPVQPVVENRPAAPVVDAAAAVNAAAAGAAQEQQLCNEASKALQEAGLDFEEVKAKMPSLLAKGHLWLQGTVARIGIRMVKGKWPRMVTLAEDDPLRDLMGKLDMAILNRMDLTIEKIGPGWFLLGLSVVTTLAQVAGMMEALDEEAKAEAAKKAVN